ncbi:MAG: cell division protein FtsA [Cellulosilyticaceae bacterium]
MNHTQEETLLFGLDIGTRTVIGSVGYIKEGKWTVLECVCMEHVERAMMDGQIHDIQKVAAIVEKVKKELEDRLGGKSLKQVAIAAAGRVLNTQITIVEKQFEEIQEITAMDIQALEMAGIEEAKKLVEQEKKLESTDYFCVAHTVIHYYLEDYMIANLEGHKGQKIGAKLLATFLPKGVVDSLYAVTSRVGLEVSHLTLEPIAAMNAVIPDNMRLLNLALVDIGAGTSDIAITKEGSVVAYGMIPQAGDEVTEKIVHEYLVDFNMAERMKQAINKEESISYEDIIGIPSEVSKEALLTCIEPPIQKLAEQIGKQIAKLNGKKSPNAVFCVGGGSQMPGLMEALANVLELPPQRVAMRSTQHIQQIDYKCEVPNGPEMITPIGICLTAIKEQQNEFTLVYVNGVPTKLLNTKKLTVLDALLERGIQHTQIFPTNGKTLMFKLNEERIRIKGKVGKPSTLLLNNSPASLETTIEEGDEVLLIEAKAGEDAMATVAMYVAEEDKKTIIIDGKTIQLPLIFVGGDCVDFKYHIQSQDCVTLCRLDTIESFLRQMGKEWRAGCVQVNGQCVATDYQLKHNDVIEWQEEKKAKANHDNQEAQQISETSEIQGIKVIVNDEEVVLPYQKSPYMFVNIFDYIDFDLTKPQGTVQLILNHKRAAVTDVLQEGDKLQIYWEN